MISIQDLTFTYKDQPSPALENIRLTHDLGRSVIDDHTAIPLFFRYCSISSNTYALDCVCSTS